mgnify:CR=1 FL=1
MNADDAYFKSKMLLTVKNPVNERSPINLIGLFNPIVAFKTLNDGTDKVLASSTKYFPIPFNVTETKAQLSSKCAYVNQIL